MKLSSGRGSRHRAPQYLIACLYLTSHLAFAQRAMPPEPAVDRQYSLGADHTLTLTVPQSWQDYPLVPDKASPPTIQFRTGMGQPFDMLLILPPVPSAAAAPADRFNKAVIDAAEDIKIRTAERSPPAASFSGPAAQGSYVKFADPAPKAGQYKFLTQGDLETGGMRISFSILTNDDQLGLEKIALEMLRTARLSTGEAAKEGVPPIADSGRLGVATSARVLAQSPRYLWDQRPANCLAKSGRKDPGCEIDNWPNSLQTANRIAFLYQNEQFALLDLAMAETMGSDRRFVDGSTPSDAVYWAFKQMMRAPGTDPENGEKINRWKTAIPGSAFATFAQARFAYGSAWNIRGNQYGSTVSKDSWELFNIRLQETEQMLLNAPQTLKDTPIWHHLLLAVAMDMPQPTNAPQAHFADAVKRWPRQFGFYELILTRMTPKWGGSWQLVDASITEWSNQLTSTEGKSLYARLYLNLLSQATADEMAFDWDRLKVAFEDLIAHYPSPDYKNSYASFACFAEDKPAFRAALTKLARDEIDPSGWLPGHSYEACMRWAGI